MITKNLRMRCLLLFFLLAFSQIVFSQESSLDQIQFPLIPTGSQGDPYGIIYKDEGMRLRNTAGLPSAAQGIDVDVAHIERRPRLNYDENNLHPGGLPAVGDEVTFVAHINNRGSQDGGLCDYDWTVNGVIAGSGSINVVGQNVTTNYRMTWGTESVQIGFSCHLQSGTDLYPQNNALTISSHALNVGLWVHRSVYDYFNAHQRELGVGSNSFEDWANRLCAYWNHFFERSIYPSAPNGVLDRAHLDKVIILDDPSSPIPLYWGNHPDDFDGPGDTHDRTLDYLWGIPENILNGSFYTGRTVSLNNHFYFEHPLMHEMMHGRILHDTYGSNWKIHQAQLNAAVSATASSFVLQGKRRISMRAKNKSTQEYFLGHDEELIQAQFAWNGRPSEQPAYASGDHDAAFGFSDGGLRVLLGGVDDHSIQGMAGGWFKSFMLSAEQTVTLDLRYRLVHSARGDWDEYVEALVDLDGGILSTGPNGYLQRTYGDGDGGAPADSGWQSVSLTCWLSAGTHQLTVGGYSNEKDTIDETSGIFFDDIVLVAPAESPDVLIDADFDTGPEGFTYRDDPFQDLTRFHGLIRGAEGTSAKSHPARSKFFRADCRIVEGGKLIMGTGTLPFLPRWFDHLYLTDQIGMMGGTRDGLILSELHTLLYNSIAYTRSPIGNRNWTGHGQYLRLSDPQDEVPHSYEREVPSTNLLRVLDSDGQPIVHATVELYQAQPSYYVLPWYPKFIDANADFTGVTDRSGEIPFEDDPSTVDVNEGNPFGKLFISGSAVSEIMIAKVTQGTHIDYVFLDASVLLKRLFRNLILFGDPSYHPGVLPVVVHWSQGKPLTPLFEIGQGPDAIVIDERGNLLLNGNRVHYSCVWDDDPDEIVRRTQEHLGTHIHGTEDPMFFELRNRAGDVVFAVDDNLDLHLRGASIETASYPEDYDALRMIRDGGGKPVANFDASGCLVLTGVVVE